MSVISPCEAALPGCSSPRDTSCSSRAICAPFSLRWPRVFLYQLWEEITCGGYSPPHPVPPSRRGPVRIGSAGASAWTVWRPVTRIHVLSLVQVLPKKGDCVLDCANLLRLFVANLDPELFFKRHNELDQVQRIGVKVLEK